MKTRYKIIIALAIIAIAAISIPASSEIIGDKYCYQGWLIPNVLPLWICNNEDGGMDHSFLTEQAMREYYVPPLTETLPEYTFVTGGQTEGFSGN